MKSTALVLSMVVCILAHLPIRLTFAEEPTKADGVQLNTVNGSPFSLKFPREKALVTLFLMTDCPIANAASPEVARLIKLFEKQPVEFVAIYVDPDISVQKIEEHQRKYGITCTALLDPYQLWIDQLNVKIVPTFTLHSREGVLRYQGRIDDRYNDYGKRKAVASRFYLHDAIEAELQGKAPAVSATDSIGCHVFRDPKMEENRRWTYAEDVAPLLQKHCVTCHRLGEIGPFSLTDYEETKYRGELIEQVVANKSMPPWKADKADVSYLHQRTLSKDEIRILTTWVHDGMPLGDATKVPPTPNFSAGWKHGTPDVIIEMNEAFVVPADGPDIYRNFAIAFPKELMDGQVWVKGLEFRPSTPSVVHHALFFSAPEDLLKGTKSKDGKPGMPGGIAALIARQGLRIPNVVQGAFKNMGGWAAGAELNLLPEGLAYEIGPNSSFILATHFHPSGKEEQEKSQIGLYLTKTPPKHKFVPIQMPAMFGFFKGIDIPAGEKKYLIEDSWTLPCDVVAFGVNSHAHYLGKSMKLTADLPDGKSMVLLNITDWDFAWQEQYRFSEQLTLPAGTKLRTMITYDNSEENPRNPFSPPRRVRFGEESTDEMGSISLMAYPKEPADFDRLIEEYRQHVRDQVSLKPLFSNSFKFLGAD